MLILCNFRPDFACRIHGRVYLPSDNILRLLKGIHNLTKCYITNNKNINITSLFLFPVCKRTIDKGNDNTIGNGGQGVPESVSNTDRFYDYTFQFVEDRTFSVCLKIDLPALCFPPDNPGIGKLF